MLDKETLVKVSNRSCGTTVYAIPELGVKRVFQNKEIKEISMEELRKLSYLPGGQVILNDYLIIHNDEALKELNPSYEPEYLYTEKEIEHLLLHGTQAQFLDCLDFAPVGVLELLKELAVKLEINDLAKRQAIQDKLGFNVTKAIQINKESQEDIEVEENTPKRRTVAPTMKVNSETPVVARRVATTKYTVKK